jgi:branched-chain amino acid transport system substrate-binding protein
VHRWLKRIAMAGASAILASALLFTLGSGFENAGASSHGAPVKIGFVCSCSGALASSEVVAEPAFEAWVKSVNAKGGVDGHPVDVIYKDDATNPTTSTSEVATLVTSDDVAAIVDASGVDNAWQTYAEQHNVPVINAGASDYSFSNPDFFSAGQTVDDYLVAQVASAKKVGASTMGKLYCSEAPSCAQSIPGLVAVGKDLKVNVAYTSEISASQPSYAAECIAAKQDGVKALVVGEAITAVENVARDCDQQGFDPYQISDDGAVAESFATTPGLEDHTIGFENDIPFFVTSTPASKAEHAALEKYASSIFSSPDYGETATESWVMGLLIGAAVTGGAKAGSTAPVTASELKAGLYKMHDDTLDGMAPPLTYKKGVPNPIHCWYWFAVQHGKFTTPYGLAPTCESPPAGVNL